MGDKLVRFTAEAKIEFHKAKCFMEFSGKEEAFWEDVDKQLALILQFPDAFQIRYKDVRIIILDHFGYSIHYVSKPYGVLVYRFLNKSQDF